MQAAAGVSASYAGRDVLTVPVLVVNRVFSPVSVIPARRAILLLYGGSAAALDETGDAHAWGTWQTLPVRAHDDGIPLVSGQLRVPRVLHLVRYDRTPGLTVRLTRRNLMLRDQHQCQYCGKRPSLRDLNVDHVHPRSRGGADSWENLVVSCRLCNLKKGRRTPDEAGMKLLRSPQRPRWSTSAQILLNLREPYQEWQPFLKTG